MRRAKYWFPKLNGMVEDAISKCYQCQLCTVEHKQEPVKPSEIPDIAWHTQGSYASGKCQGNLNFFKVRELSGNFIICQGKLNFC